MSLFSGEVFDTLTAHPGFGRLGGKPDADWPPNHNEAPFVKFISEGRPWEQKMTPGVLRKSMPGVVYKEKSGNDIRNR